MKYDFIKTNPSQNMTLIIKTPVPRSEQSRVAAGLMDYSNVYAEQAGFWEAPIMAGAKARLQMMGGEFCGNAAMSIAACVAREMSAAESEKAVIPIEVSGTPGVVHVAVEKTGDAYKCEVEMPLPVTFEETPLGCIVHMPGISHVIIPCTDFAAARKKAPDTLRKAAGSMRADAAGLIFYNAEAGEIMPLVYVKSTDTMTWERGCGSGTAAVGAYTANKSQKDATLTLKQPGGEIGVRAVWHEGRITEMRISGTVLIAAEGSAYI